jgi:hypothetical protein
MIELAAELHAAVRDHISMMESGPPWSVMDRAVFGSLDAALVLFLAFVRGDDADEESIGGGRVN